MRAIRVGILIFNDVEVLDFTGPYEVFTTAARIHARSHAVDAVDAAANALFQVSLIAERLAPVRARAGLNVLPNVDLTNHPPIDLLIVPGGVVTQEVAKPHVVNWIRQVAASTIITASVCTGAFLLAKAGLLDGKRVTTHWEDLDELRTSFPSLRVEENIRWVDEGDRVTSAGISAGIDMSLHLVERLAGRDLAIKTARQMEFDWAKVPT